MEVIDERRWRSARIPRPIFSGVKHGRRRAVPRRPLSLARAGFPRVCIYDPPISDLFVRSERDGRWVGQRRFCRFVTLRCINEQTFIKAEAVFSAIANCRAALARSLARAPIDIVHFPSTSPRGEQENVFPRGARAPLNHSPLQISSSTSTANFFGILSLLKSYFLDIPMNPDINGRIRAVYFHFHFAQIQIYNYKCGHMIYYT